MGFMLSRFSWNSGLWLDGLIFYFLTAFAVGAPKRQRLCWGETNCHGQKHLDLLEIPSDFWEFHCHRLFLPRGLAPRVLLLLQRLVKTLEKRSLAKPRLYHPLYLRALGIRLRSPRSKSAFSTMLIRTPAGRLNFVSIWRVEERSIVWCGPTGRLH